MKSTGEKAKEFSPFPVSALEVLENTEYAKSDHNPRTNVTEKFEKMVVCEVCGKEVEVGQYGKFVYVSSNTSVRPRKHYYHIGCFCRNVIKKKKRFCQ